MGPTFSTIICLDATCFTFVQCTHPNENRILLSFYPNEPLLFPPRRESRNHRHVYTLEISAVQKLVALTHLHRLSHGVIYMRKPFTFFIHSILVKVCSSSFSNRLLSFLKVCFRLIFDVVSLSLLWLWFLFNVFDCVKRGFVWFLRHVAWWIML